MHERTYCYSRRTGKQSRLTCSIQWTIQVGKTICDLNSRDDFDKHSVSSSRSNRSVASRKSQRSKSSRGSLASTSSSARQRRLDLQEQITTLTVKMDMVREREETDKAMRDISLNERY